MLYFNKDLLTRQGSLSFRRHDVGWYEELAKEDDKAAGAAQVYGTHTIPGTALVSNWAVQGWQRTPLMSERIQLLKSHIMSRRKDAGRGCGTELCQLKDEAASIISAYLSSSSAP